MLVDFLIIVGMTLILIITIIVQRKYVNKIDVEDFDYVEPEFSIGERVITKTAILGYQQLYIVEAYNIFNGWEYILSHHPVNKFFARTYSRNKNQIKKLK